MKQKNPLPAIGCLTVLGIIGLFTFLTLNSRWATIDARVVTIVSKHHRPTRAVPATRLIGKTPITTVQVIPGSYWIVARIKKSGEEVDIGCDRAAWERYEEGDTTLIAEYYGYWTGSVTERRLPKWKP